MIPIGTVLTGVSVVLYMAVVYRLKDPGALTLFLLWASWATAYISGGPS